MVASLGSAHMPLCSIQPSEDGLHFRNKNGGMLDFLSQCEISSIVTDS